ncbi:MAG: efflux RND transporter periplasmic adaptor subunit [Planctomycetes bacterium]|nr:efflux RND transporter periplasmic adaptor subunit [Planctomycetota bacterium]MBL7008329.1 efflux RND transporter periplasmic adaptor subunit [Planctomycetota bacterium]
MRITPTRLLVLLLGVLLAGLLIGRCSAPEVSAPEASEAAPAAAPAAPTVWTCSMHPQVQLPEAGQCPICFMDLIPLVPDADGDAGPRALRMSEGAMALAEIQTARVIRREVAHELQLIGKVAFDETRVATITSWVPGRIERLYVDYTGVTVRPGDHLVDLYSPELYATQQELRQAIGTAARLSESKVGSLGSTSEATVIAARAKLRLLGLAEDQIAEIEASGELLEHLTIRAPIGGVVIHKRALEGMYLEVGSPIFTIADLSKVWVQLDAYESDLAWLRYGQEVQLEVEAFPGESFRGRIAFIDPVLEDATRTVKVRVNVENQDLRLKPEMFVHATVQAVLTPHGKAVDPDLAGKWMCPMHPEVVADGPGPCSECGMDLVPVTELGFVARAVEQPPLVVPASAALLTGKRAIVYVRVPDAEKPTFDGRVVVLGPRAGDWYVVREGLEEGERVVVQGAFKLDSELQLKARPSMMNPGAEERAADAADRPERYETPAAFRAQLGELAREALEISDALAADDLEAAKVAAARTLGALDGVEMALLTGAPHLAWMKDMGELRAGARALGQQPDLGAARIPFRRLSDALIHALRSFGFSGPVDGVQVTHCPMAFENAGADWLQRPGEIANPYFGAAMPRCGDAVETLESAPAGPIPAAREELPAAFRTGLGGLAKRYLEVQAALAGDDIGHAGETAGDLAEALRDFQAGSLSPAAAASWVRHHQLLLESSKALFRAELAAPARQAFHGLSQALIGALEEFGYQGVDGGLQVFHCPMAFDGAGADWIQPAGVTANPYLGAAMPRCGDAVRDLPRER